MGSIGDSMAETIPAVGASGTGYATTINAFLTEAKARLTGTVPFSALSGSTLDLGNKPIASAQYVQLYEQSVTPAASPEGRFEYYNNELYFVSAAGAIQITSAGGVNIASGSGIGGDYGGADPAQVRFVAASTRYDFWDDYSLSYWAYLRARGLDIAGGASSTNYTQLRSGATATYTLTTPAALPASNRSLLVVSSTGQIVDNDGTNTITNDPVLGGSTKIKHGDRTIIYPLPWMAVTAGTVYPGAYGIVVIDTGGAVAHGALPIDTTHTLKSVAVRVSKPSTGTTTLNVYKVVSGGATTLLATANSSTSGNVTITATLGSPTTFAASTDKLAFTVTAGNNNETLIHINVTYDVR